MNKEFDLKQTYNNANNGEDFYTNAMAILIGVAAGLLGGLFIA